MNKVDFPATPALPDAAKLKVGLMFEGVRYSEALGAAADHSLPNYYPYRFREGEPNPTGNPTARIPYLMVLRDGTHVRIKGDGASEWKVEGSRETGYVLTHDDGRRLPVAMEPRPEWMAQTDSTGSSMAEAGVSLHGDMAIINVAPGCEYFLAKSEDGRSMRCAFCTYGAPDMRVKNLNQTMSRASLSEETYLRLGEALTAMLGESAVRHIYLVGGSMRDWRAEGDRFIELARRVQGVVDRRIPLSCGSGALPIESLRALHDEDLVQNVCFNLEVWSEPLFRKICPGKQAFVGYTEWIRALENAVGLWGPGHVYSAMVAGVELEPEHGLTWREAADLALEGAEDLCSRGVIPIYSLYWPTGGRAHPHYLSNLMAYFERMNMGYRAIRERHGLRIWDGFMCHECAYMQLECDIDRALDGRKDNS